MATTRQEQRAYKIEAYLAELRRSGTVGNACEAAGVTRPAVREWRNHEEIGEDFTQREKDAMAEFGDSLVNEVVKRGRDGWAEPVIHQGQMMYVRNPHTGEIVLDDDLEPIPLTILKKSDQLLIRAAEAHVPAYQKKGGLAIGGLGGDGDALPSKITIEFVESDGDGREPIAEEG